MCGIVGFTGTKQASKILLDGLKRLEYRGYDSAGIAVRDGDNQTQIVKAKGKLCALFEKTDEGERVKGCCGIGHTRWATHGEASEQNAHPHQSDDKSVIGVHNGIIENYAEIKQELTKHGYTFYSQTDTEVIIKLLDYYVKKHQNGPIDALSRLMMRVRGSYALAVLFEGYPQHIYLARKDSPMIIGTSIEGNYLASDVSALLPYTRRVYYLDNLQIARLEKQAVTFYNVDKKQVQKQPSLIEWEAQAAEKAGYPHFMIKEIHEQPRAVADTLKSLCSTQEGRCANVGLTQAQMQQISELCFVACGSAYHACVTAQYVIEDLAKLPVRVELASEFRYRKPLLAPNTLVIVVSQSGETADSLAALREAKAAGVKTLAIVNVVGSSIAREADGVLYTQAGPEIAVATTKAYSAQLIATYLLAIEFARARGCLDKAQSEALMQELQALPSKIERTLESKERLQSLAAKVAEAKDIFFIGRGLDYAVSLEGSLKMKEITYIHSEAYAAGELKHGTISLVEEGTLVVSVLTQKSLFEKTLGNMSEVKSRGAYLIGLTTQGNRAIEEVADFTVYIPCVTECFSASLAVVPLQLLAYYASVVKGLDVDKPRNLAKSVTVE